ncbi:translation initiation factor 2 [Pseudomonas sp. dw_358]|uniref:translation initiation factor 2 n=1 Tax=Pseudomonas sp. dw_358 TaxID=2720083 RepID=UPI001BD57279|nr:translation initiation factor 2 [Pseudomonas sp. dw_358]
MTALRCVVVLLLGLATPFTCVWSAAAVDSAGAPVKAQVHKSPMAKPTLKDKKKATSASKTKSRKEADAIAAPVPKAKLDLSLPAAMVKDLHPPGKPAAVPVHDGYLPPLFPDKKPDDSYQINPRLLSNEMQLQLRNEDRKIDGAALDFEFKQ